MKTIPLTDIIIPLNRQRRDFEPAAIAELMYSIEHKGLLHPIVLRADHRTLLSGERRLRAIKLLYAARASFRCGGEMFTAEAAYIPYVPVDVLTPLELEEAELEENLLRKDLTWQEKANAIARLHRLREEQNGKQTFTATAEEVFGIIIDSGGPQITAIRDAITVDSFMHDPEVAAAPDLKSALKVITRKTTAAHRELLAKSFDLSKTEHEIWQGDAIPYLQKLPANTVDIVLTDPPYGIGAEDFGSQAAATHEYEDSSESMIRLCEEMLCEASRICKPSSFIFVFCDIRQWPLLSRMLDATWAVWPTPLIWNKGNGMLPVPDRGPRRCYEAIFYAYRGNRKWLATGVSDIIDVPGLVRPIFGAQKPSQLYKDILSRVCLPGDVVLDPFAGSGPILTACTELQCKAIAIELIPEKVHFMMTERLEKSNGE